MVQYLENTLKEISRITGGKYFRATDNKKLEEIYKSIDKMEKTRVQVTSYRKAREEFYAFAGMGLFFLFLEVLLTNTYLNKIP